MLQNPFSNDINIKKCTTFLLLKNEQQFNINVLKLCALYHFSVF